MVMRQWEGQTEGREAMGLALTLAEKRGIVCYVLVEPSKALAERIPQPVAVVLGCVMAHEIGHLMGLRRGPNGIMRPKFERRDIQDATMGNLHFGERRRQSAAGPRHGRRWSPGGPLAALHRNRDKIRLDPTLSCPYHALIWPIMMPARR
jgi:hypothetical protein